MAGMGKLEKKPFAPARAMALRRWKGVSEEDRSAIGTAMVKARWAKADDKARQAARDRLAEARKKRWPKDRSKSDEQEKRKR